MAGLGMKLLNIMVGWPLVSNITNIRTSLTQYIFCSNEEILDHSLLDEEDNPIIADRQNDDISLEDYLDDANNAFET